MRAWFAPLHLPARGRDADGAAGAAAACRRGGRAGGRGQGDRPAPAVDDDVGEQAVLRVLSPPAPAARRCCGRRASAAWRLTSRRRDRSAARLAEPAANLDFAVQAVMQIDPSMDSGSWLNSLADIGVKPTLATQVFARRILNRQFPDGHWSTIDVRPPQSYSVVTGTAVAVRAIQRYLPASMHAERRAAVDRARQWLQAVVPADTEERTFQLLGLSWTGASPAALEPLVRGLLAAQRPDGGWAQLPRLGSGRLRDRSGAGGAATSGWARPKPSVGAARTAVSAVAAARRTARGSSRLVCTNKIWSALRTSRPASRMARTRSSRRWARRGRPWRCSSRCRRASPDATVLDGLPIDTSAERPWMQHGALRDGQELGRLLDQGLDPNSRTPAGTTALMMAAHDADKVRAAARAMARTHRPV